MPSKTNCAVSAPLCPNLGNTVVPSFKTVTEFMSAMGKRSNHVPVDLYPRDGTTSVAAAEEKVSRLAGIEPNRTVSYTSGMSALIAVVESASPTKGTVVLHAVDEYSRTRKYIGEILAQRGARSIRVDTTSMENLANSISLNRPDIIVLETVANGPNVPVLDIGRFFALPKLKAINPLILLDNTLPTPTLINPNSLLRDGFRVAVVESGMKAYSANSELLGIVYSHDLALLAALRENRITTGAMPSFHQVNALNLLLPESKGEFDRKNMSIMSNTLVIARACHGAEGDRRAFQVFHPNLPGHANFALANALYPNGSTPLFYLQATGAYNQVALAEALWSDWRIRETCELGQSFGFERTRIFPDHTYPSVRISGGYDGKNIDKTAASFREVLLELRR